LLIYPGIPGGPDFFYTLISGLSRSAHPGFGASFYLLLKTSGYRPIIALVVLDDVNSIPAEISQYYKIKKVPEKG